MKKVFLTIMAAATLISCDIDQKKKAELPDIDVDIDAEAGQLPTFDVDWADVNVGTTTKTVKVPKVVIVMEEEEIEVPYIDVEMPEEDGKEPLEKEEQVLMVEVEVTDNEHELEIKEIWANRNNLLVVSELEKTNTRIGNKKMRVSDQVTLNAPDLNVKYYIVGEKPDRMFNSRFKYFNNMSELKDNVSSSYKKIYTK